MLFRRADFVAGLEDPLNTAPPSFDLARAEEGVWKMENG